MEQSIRALTRLASTDHISYGGDGLFRSLVYSNRIFGGCGTEKSLRRLPDFFSKMFSKVFFSKIFSKIFKKIFFSEILGKIFFSRIGFGKEIFMIERSGRGLTLST